MKAKILIIILLEIIFLGMPSCLKDDPLKLAYNGFQPLAIDDDWKVSTPAVENWMLHID